VINWEDNTKRKIFRLALQRVYPNKADLRIFVSEELNENLATIASDNNLQETAFDLIVWAQAKSRLDEVFEVFCRENLGDRAIVELQQRPMIEQSSNLREEDWKTLFEQFFPYDFADIQRAFLRGFQRALNVAFQEVRPDHSLLTEQAQIQELLAAHDKPELAVRFVESVIVELQRSSEGNGRDVTGLKQWRDRIAQRFDVSDPVLEPKPINTTARHAYLLIALEEIGSDVNVYPELRITGTEAPIRFGAQPTTCPLDQVAYWISGWICQAENVLGDDNCDDIEVTLEVFLPCQHLEEDIATTWMIKARRGGEQSLGTYRRFVVRSSDRIRDRQIQRILKQKWQQLETSVQAQNVASQIYCQKDCPNEKGTLCAVLTDLEATVLKLFAQLPADPAKRRDLLNDIIDAALPIALWSADRADADASTLNAEFDQLLQHSHLTNFAGLAKQWRLRRMNSESAKHIRLLCDRPDRLPRLPDLKYCEDEDAIVA